MERYDKFWSGCLFVFIAVIFGVQIPFIKLTTIAGTSRLIPYFVCIMLMIFGIPLIIQGFQEMKQEKTAEKNTKEQNLSFFSRYKKVFFCALFFAFYAFTLTKLGFIVSSSLYLFSMYYVMAPKEKYNHLLFVLMAVAIPIFLYLVFVNGFRVILPKGTVWR